MKARSVCLTAACVACFSACGGSSESDDARTPASAGQSGSSAIAGTGGRDATGGTGTSGTANGNSGDTGNNAGQGGETSGGDGGTPGASGSPGEGGADAAGSAGQNAAGDHSQAGASGSGESGASNAGNSGTGAGGTNANGGSSQAGNAGAGGAAEEPTPMCKCGTTNCGECPPIPEVTPAGTNFKMFATEVTNAQYAAFLAANPPTANQPNYCKWNGSFVPSNGWPAQVKDDYPVVHVDFCDAYAFCAWAGRRLCGAIDGGGTSYDQRANASSNQWFAACSGNGENDYPYGDTYEAKTCNDEANWDNPDDKRTLPVASLSECVSGGAYDLSGNVWEWEDSCIGTDGELDTCYSRGGSYFTSDPLLVRCRSTSMVNRNTSRSTLGFRCCE